MRWNRAAFLYGHSVSLVPNRNVLYHTVRIEHILGVRNGFQSAIPFFDELTVYPQDSRIPMYVSV